MRTKKLIAAAVGLGLLSTAFAAHSAAIAQDVSALASDSTLETLVCDNYTPANDYGINKVDPVTLEISQIGANRSNCNGYSFNSIAFNPFDGRVYSVSTYYTGGQNQNLTSISLDGTMSNDVKSFYVDTDLVNKVVDTMSIAINPLTGDAFIFDETNQSLYSLNLSTGVMHLIAGATGKSFEQMSFSPDGNLYGYDHDNDQLDIIDPATGATTLVQDAWSTKFPDTLSFRQIYGFTFDSNGTLFLSINGANSSELWWLSPTDQFAAPTQVAGANPNANPSLWIDTANFWSSAVPQIGANPIVITYGLQKLTFDATTNGGTAVSPRVSRFFPPTILTAAGLQANQPVVLPTIADRAGYTTDGWFDAASGGTKVGVAGDSYVPAGASDITLYAQFTKIVTVKPTTTKAVAGFHGDSALLNAKVKRELRALVTSHSSITQIACVGTTSAAKASSADRALAKARGKASCAYLKHLVPSASVKVGAKPATGVGRSHRAVIVTVTRQG